MREMRLLCVNCGSSSVRLALLAAAGEELRVLARRHEPEVGQDRRALLDGLLEEAGSEPQLVVHRLVSGGGARSEPVWLGPDTEERLARGVALAPIHLPLALAWMESVRSRLGTVPTLDAASSASRARSSTPWTA